MSTVLIKELADPNVSNFGLEKEGRSKLPGCGDFVQPAFKNGKWITGIDETAPDVIAKGVTEIERVRKEREELEALTGENLSPTNHEFWENILVPVNRNVAYDTTDPMSRIYLAILRARKVVAPAPDSPTAEYTIAKYYLAKPAEEATHKLKPKKEKAEAMANVVALMKDLNRAKLVGKYLGFSVAEETSTDVLYDMFLNYIDRFPKDNTVKEFNEANSKSIEELQVTFAFEDAIKYRIIVNDKGTFRRGTIALGRTKKDAVAKLLTVEFSGELESILQEVEESK